MGRVLRYARSPFSRIPTAAAVFGVRAAVFGYRAAAAVSRVVAAVSRVGAFAFQFAFQLVAACKVPMIPALPRVDRQAGLRLSMRAKKRRRPRLWIVQVFEPQQIPLFFRLVKLWCQIPDLFIFT